MSTIEIPGYEILHEVGEGGMAHVYLALQKSLERQVAIKILSSELVADKDFLERFLREGKTVAQLNHRNIVSIYDSGEYKGSYFLSMEYIPGGTLGQRLDSRFLPLESTLDIVGQIASALAFAHEHKLVHRDVKPTNVLFRHEKEIVLGDFGIAKTVTKHDQMTRTGMIIGTPDYMSPEQIMGQALTGKSDLYSLGIVFYEMLTGELPYQGDTSVVLAAKHLHDTIPKLPEQLRNFQPILNRLTAKDPRDRFNSASEFINELENVEPQPEPPPPTKLVAEIVDKEVTSKVTRPTLGKEPGIKWHWPIGIGLTIIVVAVAAMIYFSTGRTPNVSKVVSTGDQTVGSRLAPEIQAKVDVLLELGDTHLEVGFLTQPPGSNAYESYKQVLELDPENQPAKTGIKQIVDRLEQRAEQIRDSGEIEESLKLIEEGLRLVPTHPGLLALRRTMEADQSQ